MIEFLPNHAINKSLWDQRISTAQNPRVYALSRYLDAVFPEWWALLSNDYQEIMPVFPKKKFGLNYLHQPMYVQQSGIFFQQKSEFFRSEEFIKAIPEKYKYIDVHLNFKNLPPKGIKLYKEKKINQLLRLDRGYEELYGKFSESHRKNIRRSKKYKLFMKELTEYDLFFDFKQQFPGEYRESMSVLKKICQNLDYQNIKVFSVLDENQNTHAVALFIYWNNTLTWLSSGVSHEARENKALFFLVDKLIDQFAGSKMILDFAGSSLPGVWYFNNGFGAADEIYYHITLNRLPLIIKRLKK
ncbi:MAG: hypothetical protein GX437_03045 [Sphingobacteriales bacterium]|nr:hypothetical protein [Sphingobacteriales bacterium]